MAFLLLNDTLRGGGHQVMAGDVSDLTQSERDDITAVGGLIVETTNAAVPTWLADLERDRENSVVRSDETFASKVLNSSGGDLTGMVNVESISNLPDPVGDTITLADNMMYAFNGLVDVTPYSLRLGDGTQLVGRTYARDGFYRTSDGGSGLALVVANTGSANVEIKNLIIRDESTPGKVFAVSRLGNVFVANCAIEGNLGTWSAIVSAFTACSITQWDSGLEVTGGVAFTMVVGTMRQKAGGTGTGLNFTGATFSSIRLLGTDFYLQAGGTGISGLASNGNFSDSSGTGDLRTLVFAGDGSPLSANLDPDDLQWAHANNRRLASSLAACTYGMQGNATVTTITAVNTWTKIAGTTTVRIEKRFAHADNRATYLDEAANKPFVVHVALDAIAGNGDDLEFGISADGVDPVGYFPLEVTNTKYRTVAFAADAILSVNSYVEIWARNTSGTANITVKDLAVAIYAIPQ